MVMILFNYSLTYLVTHRGNDYAEYSLDDEPHSENQPEILKFDEDAIREKESRSDFKACPLITQNSI